MFQFTDFGEDNEGDCNGFNGYFDTGFHFKDAASIPVTSMCNFSGEGPLPPSVSRS
jgi:hypothetical protein